MPIKWLAVETLRTRSFSFKTDVWSYGILMWEIYSGGKEPYPGHSFYPSLISQARLPPRLRRKSRTATACRHRRVLPSHESIEGMPAPMADVMRSCWLEDDTRRPTFTDIKDKLCSVKNQCC